MALQGVFFATLCLAALLFYIGYKPPRAIIRFMQYRFPDVLFHASTQRKIVALTIDDAPSQHTQEILTLLKENNSTATFFIIGDQVEQRKDVLQDISAAGSELGNHAMHDEPSISLPSAVLEAEIRQVDDYIEQAYHSAGLQRPARGHYFRPGSGIFNQRILDVATLAGYRTVLGSIYPHDPFINVWRVNAWHILSMLSPGAVIICHDRRSWTLPMLRRVLPEMKKRGYEVVSVSEFLDLAKT